jgi:hypothetical protein
VPVFCCEGNKAKKRLGGEDKGERDEEATGGLCVGFSHRPVVRNYLSRYNINLYQPNAKTNMSSCGCVLPSPLPCPPCAQIASVHRDQAQPPVTALAAYTGVLDATLAVYKPSMLTATWTGYAVATDTTTLPPVVFEAELSYTTGALPTVYVPISQVEVLVPLTGSLEKHVPFTVSGAVTVDVGAVTVHLRVRRSGGTDVTFEAGGTLTVVTNRSCCPPLSTLC